MFWKRYYESFPVRMEIIANNAIIVFCNLVEFAIFAVTNFFSLFSIAVFNIPISHKIIILLFLLQSYCFFRYFQTFLYFFLIFARRSPDNHKFCLYAGCPVFLPFSVVVFRLCPVSGAVPCPAVSRVRRCFVCPDDYLHTIIHTRIHTRAHVRARGFLDRNF